jgi:hypothetical protein
VTRTPQAPPPPCASHGSCPVHKHATISHEQPCLWNKYTSKADAGYFQVNYQERDVSAGCSWCSLQPAYLMQHDRAPLLPGGGLPPLLLLPPLRCLALCFLLCTRLSGSPVGQSVCGNEVTAAPHLWAANTSCDTLLFYLSHEPGRIRHNQQGPAHRDSSACSCSARPGPCTEARCSGVCAATALLMLAKPAWLPDDGWSCLCLP